MSGKSKKICCILNFAPHYRKGIFLQMEENGAIRTYKIILDGKVSTPSLANELWTYVNKYDNLSLMDAYVEEKQLIDLIRSSKTTLFTYHSDSFLSSGALMDSFSYGTNVVGPAVGAFNDLNELGLITTYSDLKSLIEKLTDYWPCQTIIPQGKRVSGSL